MIFLGMVLVLVVSCNKEDNETYPTEFRYEFDASIEGWEVDFADYPVGEETFYELHSEHSFLPDPLDETEGAIKITGNNHSDDLFMFARKKVSGFQSNTTYKLVFTIEFASNVPDGMFGVGGSPGESVIIKAGATSFEPEKVVDNDNFYRMNIDKSNQAQSGEDMIVIGDFSNDTDEDFYTLKTVSNNEIFEVTSDENGEFWLIVGTDSGFESTTTIYYNTIHVEIL